MTDVLTLFFALLALLSLLGAVAIAVAFATGRRAAIVPALSPYALPLAAAVTTVSTLGSLYLSEVANFIPCRLCWVQRGFMYPMAATLILAVWKRWDGIWRFAIPWSLLGAAVAIFHIAEQRGWVGGESFCSATVPCSGIWVDHFGFVTIPFMALCGFLLTAALMAVHAASARTSNRTTESTYSINR